MSQINKSRIAKNTMFLYFRMILIMLISFYTTRVVFRTLGVVDYGILTVVGGLVILLAFINGTMSNASQRFFAIELGQNNKEQLKKAFTTNINLYIIFSAILLVVAETIGLWFLNHKMNIPADRIVAANWVYHLSVASTIISIITIPYGAIIIAREKMKFYAYISLLEASLKLAIVYLLVISPADKLITYAILLFVVAIINSGIHAIYCSRKFEECHYSFSWDKALFKEMLSYSGWNMYGVLAVSLRNHGVNVLLNIVFGPAVNAARSISYQIFNAINQFTNNFFTAVRPQLTKSYAAGERKGMLTLLFQSSKFSYYLLLFLALPIFLEAPGILKIWLTDVPEYAIVFSRLVVINAIIESLQLPIMTSIQATGRVKFFELCTGTVLLLNIPVCYLFLKAGYPPQSTMVVSILLSLIAQIIRVVFAHKQLAMSISDYCKFVVAPILIVTTLSAILPVLTVCYFETSFYRLLATLLISTLSCAIAIYFAGISKNERKALITAVQKKCKGSKE
ncbi:oligosaccharide flippase family protein [Bacteroidales bacterium OttesenSCG-928-B11]|nr:oligosaccharide flippase family protein [Bacteroidales bacterium OttesenSCG-928-E04]MDL2308434.1 oligosaccharide flippase family protein [Bacteroidales bacterium OttesenSCG-928-C03]MDL2311298.1 oligosaccharide flippase family protein [Bacteroidales bacterium OttesenSCG-928-B11]MDL2326402.1 oligosaccharide flippase family protein [Bacteroidales bacterium OttesenSCG-928-A14]